MNTSVIPLSLYIHIPWCIRKCPYCDFNSHPLKQELPEANYIDALIADLEQDLPKIWGRRILSIFIGGGTPSLFSPKEIERLLTAIRARLICSPDIEITLEANPGTVEQKRFEGFYAAGINRLSLGIQSFQEDKLKTLGRIHGSGEAIKAIEAAQAAGFTNFNLDLMHGLPQQTVNDALYDLQIATSLRPTHLSWYQLTLEPNTLFYRQPPQLPNEDFLAEIQNQGHAYLIKQGFSQYEVSAYCKPGFECRHNINYWEFGDYLGIGAGAHSKITDLTRGQIVRFSKVKHPKDYLNAKQAFIAEEKIINANELPLEFMMNALRLKQKISVKLFEERTSLKLDIIEKSLTQARNQNLLRWDDRYIYVTKLGQKFLNNLLEIFMHHIRPSI